MIKEASSGRSRRELLKGAAALAAAPVVAAVAACAGTPAAATSTREPGRLGSSAAAPAIEQRKLGPLEVSRIGLGVQNMSRTYQQTIPTRSEMHNIIRAAGP